MFYKLNLLKEELKTNVKVIPMDISNIDNCKKLYDKVKKDDKNIIHLHNNIQNHYKHQYNQSSCLRNIL